MTPTAPAPEDTWGEEVERWQRRWPHWTRWQCELAADESWPNRHRTAPAPEVTCNHKWSGVSKDDPDAVCMLCGAPKVPAPEVTAEQRAQFEAWLKARGNIYDDDVVELMWNAWTAPKEVTAEPLLADVEAMIAKLDAITSWGDMDEALKENADLLRRLAARKGAQIVYSPDAKAMSDRVKAAEAERDAALAAPKTAEPMANASPESDAAP